MERRRKTRRVAIVVFAAVAAYLALAYFMLPLLWKHYDHQKALANHPMTTSTAQGIPGDPLNVGLVGAKEEVIRAVIAAGWFPADPITLKSSAEIAGSVLLERPYHDAPVSDLFYEGRKQDLAFEKPVGSSADQRHHVRLWKVLDTGEEDRPVWLGSASFDKGVGVSHYTGAITHHIAPDVDADRDLLIGNIETAGMLSEIYQVTGVGLTLFGRNGGGDPYFTDGELTIGVIRPGGIAAKTAPQIIPSPVPVQLKNQIWNLGKQMLSALPSSDTSKP
ncbi:MAG: LssY C-terminal domain-containing protein [Phyllobacterium sp.]